MKAATKRFFGLAVEHLRAVALLEHAGAHDGDPVAHRHRLGLVVRDVQRGDADAALNPTDLGAHLHAKLGVEVGQRLVHQEDAGLADDGAAHRDALTLATREQSGLLIQQVGQSEDLRRVGDLLA